MGRRISSKFSEGFVGPAENDSKELPRTRNRALIFDRLYVIPVTTAGASPLKHVRSARTSSEKAYRAAMNELVLEGYALRRTNQVTSRA